MEIQINKLNAEMEYFSKYKDLKKEKYIFTYTGALAFKDVILLKELIEKILVIQDIGIKQKRRVLNILIEALQNSFIHGDNHIYNDTHSSMECMLLLGKEENSFFIVLGNFIKNEAVPVLRKKLDKLINMDMAELRELYLQTLDTGEITNKGGASLGLVKMLLDSSKNSTYQFYPFDEDYSFFSIELMVSEV